MDVSEIGLCSGHNTSGVWVNEFGEMTVPHGYMLGVFTFGKISTGSAVGYIADKEHAQDNPHLAAQIEAERTRVLSTPLEHEEERERGDEPF